MTPHESQARAYCSNTQTIRGAIHEAWLHGLLAEIAKLREENAVLMGCADADYDALREELAFAKGEAEGHRKQHQKFKEKYYKMETAVKDMFYYEDRMRHHSQIRDILAFDECKAEILKIRAALREALEKP